MAINDKRLEELINARRDARDWDFMDVALELKRVTGELKLFDSVALELKRVTSELKLFDSIDKDIRKRANDQGFHVRIRHGCEYTKLGIYRHLDADQYIELRHRDNNRKFCFSSFAAASDYLNGKPARGLHYEW